MKHHDIFLARFKNVQGIRLAVDRALNGLKPPLEVKGRSVFLKVNLMKGAPPQMALNTHPEVIRAVIRWVRLNGGNPSFGDSCGIPGHTHQAAKVAGYLDLAKEEKTSFVNLDAGKFVPIEFHSPEFGTFWVSRHVLNSDIRITLPKIKTHTLMGFTGALKNQMGLLPGATKAGLHVRTATVVRLARAILEINSLVPFQVGMMDGTFALEGGGSRGGRPRWIGCVLASRNLLSLDRAVFRILGWNNPQKMPLLQEAERLGLGNTDGDEIDITGDQLNENFQPFRHPGWEPKKQPWITKTIYRLRERSFEPAHNLKRCLNCGECAEICPVNAVQCIEGSWIDLDNCIRCFACSACCPAQALTPAGQWYLKPWLKARMQGIAHQ